jgi:hypothetical protein
MFNVKHIVVTLFIIILPILLTSGCTLPEITASPLPDPSLDWSKTSFSSTPGVTIVKQGNSIVAKGSGPYNVKKYGEQFGTPKKDPIPLKSGTTSVKVTLFRNGAYGCTVDLGYFQRNSEYISTVPVYSFTSEDRDREKTVSITVPYTQEYYLIVNYYDDWEVVITQ